MNTTDLFLFDILGSLLPAGTLLLSLMLVVFTVQTVRATPVVAVAPKAVFEEKAATPPTNAVVDSMRTARGRVATAMRSTRNSRPVEQYAAA